MINFYAFYSHGGLDKEEYAPLIRTLRQGLMTTDLVMIEHIIKKVPYYAYRYARTEIRGRWPAAEPYIMKDLGYAYMYTIDIIKGRWIEAEDSFKDDVGIWLSYCAQFQL